MENRLRCGDVVIREFENYRGRKLIVVVGIRTYGFYTTVERAAYRKQQVEASSQPTKKVHTHTHTPVRFCYTSMSSKMNGSVSFMSS